MIEVYSHKPGDRPRKVRAFSVASIFSLDELERMGKLRRLRRWDIYSLVISHIYWKWSLIVGLPLPSWTCGMVMERERGREREIEREREKESWEFIYQQNIMIFYSYVKLLEGIMFYISIWGGRQHNDKPHMPTAWHLNPLLSCTNYSSSKISK